MASRNGGSKDVEAVMPKARFLVTAAIAEMGCSSQLLKSEVIDRTHDGRVSHRPLCGSADTVVETVLICIVSAVRVCQEKSIDIPALQQFGQVNPIIKLSFCGRLVLWVLHSISI